MNADRRWKIVLVIAVLALWVKVLIHDYQIVRTAKELKCLTIHEDCFYTNQMNLNRILVNR